MNGNPIFRYCLYRVTMALEIDPNALAKKARWHNKKDEDDGFICLSLSTEIIFHIDGLIGLNKV